MDRSVCYFTLSQKILSFGGLWYTQPKCERLFRYCVISFISVYVVLGESCQLIYSDFDVRSVVRLLQIFALSTCGAATYHYCVLHFKTIETIYSYIVKDSQRLKDDTELKIMQQYAHYSNLVTFSIGAMAYAHLTINITSSLLRIILSTNEIRSDLDLFPIISCYDYFSSRTTYYYPILMYQTIAGYTLMTVSIACYSKFFTFILHACARLSIIKYKICSPFIRNSHNDDVPVTQIDLSHWIIDIVQRISRTSEFINLINTVSEKIYLFVMSLGFFQITLGFLCIPMLLEQKTIMRDVLALAVYISGMLCTIYVNCYIGQKLTDYSTEVYREICLVPFHEMSLKTQKLLLTTLAMCSRPYVISIGKIYVASHEFFSSLLRSSVSFAMVVHSLQNI